MEASIHLPPDLASDSPFSERGQSYQPVKRFSLFHVDSPCLTSTKVCADNSVAEIGVEVLLF